MQAYIDPQRLKKGTPSSYIQLYKKCWNYDPNRRPELEKIKKAYWIYREKKIWVCASKFDELISDTT
ncbi:hypothetical protein C2G38_2109529, partial [Gigaspora rosea]